MAESLKTILMSALTSKATPAESDTMIVGEGNVLKKITFSQLFTFLKDKLGINTLNTNFSAEAIYVDCSTVNKTYFQDPSLLLCKRGKTVFFQLNTVFPQAISAWTQMQFGDQGNLIPEEYRPSQDVTLAFGSGATGSSIIFYTTGTVKVVPWAAIPQMSMCGVCGFYKSN